MKCVIRLGFDFTSRKRDCSYSHEFGSHQAIGQIQMPAFMHNSIVRCHFFPFFFLFRLSILRQIHTNAPLSNGQNDACDMNIRSCVTIFMTGLRHINILQQKLQNFMRCRKMEISLRSIFSRSIRPRILEFLLFFFNSVIFLFFRAGNHSVKRMDSLFVVDCVMVFRRRRRRGKARWKILIAVDDGM